MSTWPEKFTNDKQKNENIDIVLRFLENRVRVSAINYKISAKSGKTTAFQLIFTHGIQGKMMIAKGETEADMKTVWLTKKQYISKLASKRKNKFTIEWTFSDQYQEEILKLPVYQEQTYTIKNTKAIIDGDLFYYTCCQNHEDYLMNLNIMGMRVF